MDMATFCYWQIIFFFGFMTDYSCEHTYFLLRDAPYAAHTRIHSIQLLLSAL